VPALYAVNRIIKIRLSRFSSFPVLCLIAPGSWI